MWNHYLIEGYVNYLATPAVHTPDLDEYYKKLVYYDGDGPLAAQKGDLSPELCARWNALQEVGLQIQTRQKELYQGGGQKCPPYGSAKGEASGEQLRGAKPSATKDASPAKTSASKKAAKAKSTGKRGGKP